LHNSDNYIVKRKAMSEATAFMISSVLQDVNLNGGNPVNVARKTGTTNYDSKIMESKNLPWDAIRDSWIIGYSTKTVVGLWYGYDFIDSEYCLHNIPASVQKDKIFNALVNSGAMESNREVFKQPDSVVKVGVVMGTNPPKLAGSYAGNVVYEYFKKEYAPEETYVEEKLAAPEDFEASYNKVTKKVNLSWKAVSTSGIDDKNYGTFGYNIYFGSTLIGFTEKTSFTYTPPSISACGTKAATESITIILTASLRTKASQISNACSPVSGCDSSNSSMSTPSLSA
jgi:membrane peptidoglycan carboxypeptidase